MLEPTQIIELAIDRYKPKKFILMVSGGHDSITNAHVTAQILSNKGIEFSVYHGDTTIGIPATQQYVREICDLYNWPLAIRQPPKKEDHYENIVAKYGFPGPTKSSHRYMYRRLKERALRHYVTHELKTSPYKRENILLCSGVRQQESAIRMGYTEVVTKDDARIWCNPIFYWSEQDCTDYMANNRIPRNPVKDKICISGECLCGAFARNEEWIEIKTHYPETAAKIEALHEIAKANGHPWHWASGPQQWKKEQREKNKPNFMCVGCEKKMTK